MRNRLRLESRTTARLRELVRTMSPGKSVWFVRAGLKTVEPAWATPTLPSNSTRVRAGGGAGRGAWEWTATGEARRTRHSARIFKAGQASVALGRRGTCLAD